MLQTAQKAFAGAVAEGHGELQAAALHGQLPSVLERELHPLEQGVRVVDPHPGPVGLLLGEEGLGLRLVDGESDPHAFPPSRISRKRRMWAGVEPQQPPTMEAPAARSAGRSRAICSGVSWYTTLKSSSTGWPALGCAITGRPLTLR